LPDMNLINLSGEPISAARKSVGTELRRTLGDNVRKFRNGRNLSQEALAFEAGLDQAYVSRMERGACNPTILIVERLAKALGVPLDHLFSNPRK